MVGTFPTFFEDMNSNLLLCAFYHRVTRERQNQLIYFKWVTNIENDKMKLTYSFKNYLSLLCVYLVYLYIIRSIIN